MSERPPLVQQAEKLRAAFQCGSDVQMLEVIGDGYGGMLSDLMVALTHSSERTLTYAAPQLASLAERVGWLMRIEGDGDDR